MYLRTRTPPPIARHAHIPPCQCVSAVDMGGQVDSLLLESGYLFVGMHTTSNQGLIKVWNTTTGAEYVLEGHQGAVLSLAAANGALFSGGHDKTLRVWVMDPATGGFGCQVCTGICCFLVCVGIVMVVVTWHAACAAHDCCAAHRRVLSMNRVHVRDALCVCASRVCPMQAVLTSAQNGHKAPIQSLTSVGSFLFSADWQGTLKVRRSHFRNTNNTHAAHQPLQPLMGATTQHWV